MLSSHRRRSVVALASFLALVGGLMLPTTAGAADPVSSLAVTDPANDSVTGEPPGTAVEAPKADILAASARYQNDHVNFTMKTREGDDLSNPDSLLWWVIGTDDGCCGFVSLKKGSNGALRVLLAEPGFVPPAGDTSHDCPGSGASYDVALGTYIASLPASCFSGDPSQLMPSFQWQAGRRFPTGVGSEYASDFAPNDDFAGAVTNAQVFGYWAIGSDGKIYPFGDAIETGEPPASANLTMIDIEAARHGTGYWTVDQKGIVTPFGVVHYGNMTDLKANERVVSISGTPTGAGYWIFTNKGRAVAFGDATKDLGDVSTLPLNAEVLDSSPTPSGKGYYLVAADGGVFALGDAQFEGSMGGKQLNGPVQSVVPDPDGKGYWLVATDGGVFAFEAPFKGSMGSTPLNQPMTGMVPYGDAYLMVAEDGGVFNFATDKEFSGSLGSNPPANPIVSITALS